MRSATPVRALGDQQRRSGTPRQWILAGVVAGLLSTTVVAAPGGAAGRIPARDLGITPRAIYGDDDRQELHAASDPRLRAAAEAVAMLVDNWHLGCDAPGGVCELRDTEPLFNGKACAEEPFATQPTAGFCTGFLIAPDLVATAGHCINELTCPFTAFVFGFAITEPGGAAKTAGLATYRCAEVVESVARYGFEHDGTFQDGADYAVVRLDRLVDDRTPLAVRREPAATVGDPLMVMGHPFGLPLKIAGGAEVRSTATTFFEANLDIAGGNSGSPVLDSDSLEVVGILVRGAPDLTADLEQGCFRSARYRNADGWLHIFSQATHAAMLPVVDSCIDQAGCLPTATTASCLPHPFLDVHLPFCRECDADHGPARKLRRSITKALRLVDKGVIATDFNLRKAEKELQRALRLLERTAPKLEQASASGRVSVACHGALRSVIDDALDRVRLYLATLPLLE